MIGAPLDLHVLTHSFPTRRASDLFAPILMVKGGTMQRRKFLGTAALGGLVATLPLSAWAADTAGLPNLAAKAIPIGKAERMARIAKAKELMRANDIRSEEHTSELQSLMRNAYAVFC